jgi:hypothetical protein
MKNDGFSFMCLIYFSRCGAVFEHPFLYCGVQHSAALPDLNKKIPAIHTVTMEYTKPSPSLHFMNDNYCCILHGPGGEGIVNVVPGGMELKLQLRWGVGQAVHTRNNPPSSVLEFIRHKQ